MMIERHTGSTELSANGTTYGTAFAPPRAETESTFDLKRLWSVIWRRRLLLVTVWAVVAILISAMTLIQPKAYTTEVKLIAGGSNQANPGNNTANLTTLPILNAFLSVSGDQTGETYAELMKQSPVAQAVIDKLHLPVTVSQLVPHVLVRPLKGTSILTVDVTWKNAAGSAKIANAFATVFVDRQRQLVAHQADAALGFLQGALPTAEEHMRNAQQALATYQAKVGIADLPAQTTSRITAIAALETKQQAAELDARQAAAQLAAVNGIRGSVAPTIVGSRTVSANPIAAQLQTQIETLKSELTSTRQTYTDNFPAVIAIRAKIADAQRELARLPANVVSGTSSNPNPLAQQLNQQAATLEGQIASARSQIATIQQQRRAAQPQIDELPAQARRIGDLERAAKSSQDVYDALQHRYQDASIARTTALSDVTITELARPDIYKVAPNSLVNVIFGILFGLVLAIVAIFVAESFDDRFRTEDDVRDKLGLPLLATIPLVDGSSDKISPWMMPLAVESFYQLVTSLRYSSHKPARVIAFTSAEQGDGKSTVVMNTAISMAKMKSRVLLIDGDLRRPTLHGKLRVSNETGLSDILVGIGTLEGEVRPTEHTDVFVLPSGRSAPNPLALLQSDEFRRLLNRAREQYDFILIDCPALQSIVDSVVIAVQAEGTVLVVSAAKSEGRHVRDCIAKLRSVDGISFLGVVLNRIRPSRSALSDYYLGGGQTIALSSETHM
ncbi:MAG: polysaccharide biosynthesis tyrosine autokinase [Vulcanimicrobiaceae bacterium]